MQEHTYTSWGVRDGDTPLYLGDGPDVLGIFNLERATVMGAPWALKVDDKQSAKATLADGRTFLLNGNLTKDKKLRADIAGRVFMFINENSSNWIIEDATGTKIAQFSGANRGVRKAILEIVPENPEQQVELTPEELAALSWFARIILESRLGRSSMMLIVTLVAASILAILALFV
ncbi:Uncharacterised protein [Corynebacterium renale]|uniref:Uncharacterized protein n=1 Tax=Corynebacterium renale TaxID=1724 RepID=A0A2A9DQ61_9CORY|nr:hypothetical protein [Corynebacterium renale]PFG28305.1 hypothetical protein ATK06_1408 [Corynebacterium renale]SQG65105.1 Uncharacterised protein [Corynebacterium renale]SQI19237.1 Uncharacterised protein [Corynebacterium renale]STC97863.1 Uncharacterised protein [Corynebacterium renale]